MRSGPGWERTLLAVVYDDTGGWYDQVVPPHEGVPNDEAPCTTPCIINLSRICFSLLPSALIIGVQLQPASVPLVETIFDEPVMIFICRFRCC